MQCPKCEAPIPIYDDTLYCSNCGERLRGEEEVSTQIISMTLASDFQFLQAGSSQPEDKTVAISSPEAVRTEATQLISGTLSSVSYAQAPVSLLQATPIPLEEQPTRMAPLNEDQRGSAFATLLEPVPPSEPSASIVTPDERTSEQSADYAVSQAEPVQAGTQEKGYPNSGWTEFSGGPAATASSGIYPPSGIVSQGYNIAPPYNTLPPNFAPTYLAPARQRNPLFIILIVLLILSIPVSFLLGLYVGKSQNTQVSRTGNLALVSTAASGSTSGTAVTTASPDQLYKQVTSQAPSIQDNLQDPLLSHWKGYEKTTYGCEIKSDGMHVHTQDTGRFATCTEDQSFTDFAFQTEMTILSGDGGGMVLRSNLNGNAYVFQVFASGKYEIYIEANHAGGNMLSEGLLQARGASLTQKNELTVIAQGSHLYFYLNKVTLATIQDSTYIDGHLGLVANDHTNATEVLYTNAQIWQL